MKTFWTLAVIAGCFALFAQSCVYAQAPPPGVAVPAPRPAISPYINLLRNNSPAYLNYYGLVRPAMQFQNQLGGLEQSLASGPGAGSAVDPATGLPLTGHLTQFLNTSHYFLNRGGQGAAAMLHPTATASATNAAPPAYRGR